MKGNEILFQMIYIFVEVLVLAIQKASKFT